MLFHFNICCCLISIGGTHSEELYLMFSHILLPRLRSANDIKVSNMLLDLWTSFAKDGLLKIAANKVLAKICNFILKIAVYHEVTSYPGIGSPPRKANPDISE